MYSQGENFAMVSDYIGAEEFKVFIFKIRIMDWMEMLGSSHTALPPMSVPVFCGDAVLRIWEYL